LWLLACAGCLGRYTAAPDRASFALSHSQPTRLGEATVAQTRQHPGESGVFVLDSNVEGFQARAQLVDQAQKTLDVQTYIFWGDLTGRLLAERILNAADRGVRVRILVDDLNVAWKDEWVTRLDAYTNVEVRVFNPFLGIHTAWPLVLWDMTQTGRLSRRMHNKMFVADNAVAIAGGRNIGDQYFAQRDDFNFQDLDVMVIGPSVQELSGIFDEYWNSKWACPVEAWREKGKNAKDARQEVGPPPTGLPPDFPVTSSDTADMLQQLLKGTLPLDWSPIRVVYDEPKKMNGKTGPESGIRVLPDVWSLLGEVRDDLIVISPYFVPGEEGVACFRELRRRGVRIRILTNSLGSTDLALAQTGYARYRRQLLDEGVEIYELKPSALGRPKDRRRSRHHASHPQAGLHTKAFILDRKTALVGSMNLDKRAYYLNTELGLVIESPEVARKLAGLFEESTQPGFCYRMGLVTVPATGSPKMKELWPAYKWPVWTTEEQGRTVSYSRQPDSTLWRNFLYGFLMLLPMEGEL
jgi:putative cardiolipin synthase